MRDMPRTPWNPLHRDKKFRNGGYFRNRLRPCPLRTTCLLNPAGFFHLVNAIKNKHIRKPLDSAIYNQEICLKYLSLLFLMKLPQNLNKIQTALFSLERIY